MPRKTYRDLFRIPPLMNRRRVCVDPARYGTAFCFVSASLAIVNGSFSITWVAYLSVLCESDHRRCLCSLREIQVKTFVVFRRQATKPIGCSDRVNDQRAEKVACIINTSASGENVPMDVYSSKRVHRRAG